MTWMFALGLVVAVAAGLRGLWSPCGLSMLSMLNPVAERARGHRPVITALWYLGGAVAGGAALGAGCALLAALVGLVAPEPDVGLVVVGVVAALAAVSDARAFGRLFPDLPRQVNEQWLGTYRRWVYAAGFGAQIGAGFTTYVMTAANYLLVLVAAFCSPGQAFALGLGFGTVRGATIAVGLLGRTPERLRTMMARVDRAEPVSRRALIAAQIGVAGLATAIVGGPPVGLAFAAALALGCAARPTRVVRATRRA